MNPAPTVAISSPRNGATITLGSPVTISATASDLTATGAVGIVSTVEFFNGTTSLGVDTTPPYSISWNPPASGNYSLQARATDSQGATGTSAPVGISVLAVTPGPVVSGFSPASGPVGTNVVVSGSNFSGVTGVQFNGKPATVWAVVSASQISVVVPNGATTGPIRVLTATTSAASASPFTVTAPAPGKVVISQIYASGGRWWSDYSNDFVELYNSGSTPVSLTGWSLQFAGGAGKKWTVLPLKGSIPAQSFYLVALAGGEYDYDLPTADAMAPIDIAAKQGKIALMRSSTALSSYSPVGLPNTSDFVGYGMADAWEGSYPALAPERWGVIIRGNGGSLDTNENYWDFDWDYPSPRNSKSPSAQGIKKRK